MRILGPALEPTTDSTVCCFSRCSVFIDRRTALSRFVLLFLHLDVLALKYVFVLLPEIDH